MPSDVLMPLEVTYMLLRESNYIRPEMIADFVQLIDATIVETNTAVGGRRASTAMHYQIAEDRGYTDIDLVYPSLPGVAPKSICAKRKAGLTA